MPHFGGFLTVAKSAYLVLGVTLLTASVAICLSILYLYRKREDELSAKKKPGSPSAHPSVHIPPVLGSGSQRVNLSPSHPHASHHSPILKRADTPSHTVKSEIQHQPKPLHAKPIPIHEEVVSGKVKISNESSHDLRDRGGAHRITPLKDETKPYVMSHHSSESSDGKVTPYSHQGSPTNLQPTVKPAAARMSDSASESSEEMAKTAIQAAKQEFPTTPDREIIEKRAHGPAFHSQPPPRSQSPAASHARVVKPILPKSQSIDSTRSPSGANEKRKFVGGKVSPIRVNSDSESSSPPDPEPLTPDSINSEKSSPGSEDFSKEIDKSKSVETPRESRKPTIVVESSGSTRRRPRSKIPVSSERKKKLV